MMTNSVTKLELVVESASNLRLLSVSGCWLLHVLFVLQRYYSSNGFLANIEMSSVLCAVNICVSYSTFYMTQIFIFLYK